jgi:hypothetical protein
MDEDPFDLDFPELMKAIEDDLKIPDVILRN